MKYKIENQELQDKEVTGWWKDDRAKKWHDFTFDRNNPLSHHLLLKKKSFKLS